MPANRSDPTAQSQYRFDRSALPPASVFYQQELGPLRPAGRDRATANCPFHKSKSGRSFSVDLTRGLWYCHGCGIGGDQIKFIMRRDSCDFKMACKTLGVWREGITPTERVEITRREQEREWNRQREAEQKDAERRERLQLRDELHTTVRIYYDLDTLLHELGPVGSEAERCWSALPPTLDCWRIEESEYCEAAGQENPYHE